MDLLITFFWSSLLELGKLHFSFAKKHENENYSKKNLQETFLRILQSKSGILFSVVEQIIGSLMYSVRVTESCSRWWYAKDKTVMQYIATLNSLPHREVMLLSSINFFFFFKNRVYSGCRKQKLLLGAVEGVHRDGGEASREDIFLYFLQGCCFFH